MGGTGFALLMLAEAVLGVGPFGRSIPDYVGAWMTPAGSLGLAGQLAFGVFPLLVG